MVILCLTVFRKTYSYLLKMYNMKLYTVYIVKTRLYRTQENFLLDNTSTVYIFFLMFFDASIHTKVFIIIL